ncbi:MAG TPA: sulfite exporter TauE/SafE family protein [Stellaceae bacterium]|nr:sulfite exporter TauE/SafE family protein [Stellaceae bacterium]
MSAFGYSFYALVLIGAFAVRSAAGFGAVLIAVPMLAFVMPMSAAVSIGSALTAITSIHQLGRGWRHIAWREFVTITAYTAVGIALGFYVFAMLNEGILRRWFGVFLVLYALYALWTARHPVFLSRRWHGLLAAATGISGGFIGALFGAGVGPIYVIYFSTVRLEREAFRVTMTTVALIGGLTRITGYAGMGFYQRSTFVLLAIGLPMVVIGSWLGDRVVRRLNPQHFGVFIGGLILLSGVALLLK